MKEVKFIDQVLIFLEAGTGGEGSPARRRYRDHLMNIGGDGGEGGSIFIQAEPNLFDLSKFRNQSTFRAVKGQFGLAHRKNGRNGEDLSLKVPLGTRVLDAKENLLFDMTEAGQKALLVKGGNGGKGNFKRKTTLPASEGEKKEIILDFRIPAEVVVLGHTNAGRSTLLSRITAVEPKISEFPFTTLVPIWGVAKKDYKAFTILELPAIIGKKTQPAPGIKFLKHMTRASVIVFLVGPQDPEAELRALEAALADNGVNTGDKYTLRVLNKTDKIKEIVPINYLPLSAKEGQGLDDLIAKIFSLLKK